MASKKSWWQSLFGPQEQHKKADALKDIQAIIEFLKEIHPDVRELIAKFQELEELEKEREVATSGVLHVNIEAQAKLLDDILKKYSFLQNDVDINGVRVAQISRQLLRRAEQVGLHDLVKHKKKDVNWRVF